MKRSRRRFFAAAIATTLGVTITATPLWAKPTHSTLIALASNDRQLWVANPDNDSVTIFDVSSGGAQKVKEITVGDEPGCIAITPDNSKVYVTNTVSGTVSVINATSFHSGACPTLECVVENVTHCSAGTNGTDSLSKPKDRQRLVKFLKSIDAQTPIFP